MHEEPLTPDHVLAQLEQLRKDYFDRLPRELETLGALARQLADERGTGEGLASLHQRLHKLAGSGGTFGLSGLSAAARALEQRVAGWIEAEGLPVDTPLLTRLLADIEALAEMAVAGEVDGMRLLARGPAEATRGEEGRVWLVDDDLFQGQELARQLESFGYEVDLFPSLEEADGAALGGERPAILISDVYFEPGGENATVSISGYAGLMALECPLLFVSSRDDFESRVHAARLGAQGYFLKPLDVPRLVNRMVQLVEQRNAAPERILIVDDDRELAAHFRLVLQAAGMQADVLDDPRSIMDRVAAIRPELVLMDLHMPQYAGPDLAGLIRQYESWDSLPIVYLSAETDLGRQVAAMSRGADDFLTKPVSDAQLVAAVRARVARSRQLEAQIARDSLTGLLKHAAIKEAIEVEVSRARRTGKPLAVALLDIDHFKAVNDTYGHATGDVVISSVAMLLRQRMRNTDIIGRYGGEEFAIALPDCPLEHAKALLEDIRRRFQDVRFSHAGRTFSCSLSAGAAASTQSATGDGAWLLNAADQALYEAKRGGRNRVCVAGEATSTQVTES
jgi:diguanylate cyclase (GGDEF)-like protein